MWSECKNYRINAWNQCCIHSTHITFPLRTNVIEKPRNKLNPVNFRSTYVKDSFSFLVKKLTVFHVGKFFWYGVENKSSRSATQDESNRKGEISWKPENYFTKQSKLQKSEFNIVLFNSSLSLERFLWI